MKHRMVWGDRENIFNLDRGGMRGGHFSELILRLDLSNEPGKERKAN